MEDMSNSKKYEMPTEILLNESEAWLVGSKETVTPKPQYKQIVCSTVETYFPHGSCVCGTSTDTDCEDLCSSSVTRYPISKVGTAEQVTATKVTGNTTKTAASDKKRAPDL